MAKVYVGADERRWKIDPQAMLPLVRSYAAHLNALAYNPITLNARLGAARHFSAWLCRSGITASAIDESVLKRFAYHRCRCVPFRRGKPFRAAASYLEKVRRFIRFLEDTGAIPAPVPLPAPTVDQRILDFEHWLRLHRGNSEQTIAIRRGVMVRLLPALGNEPAEYDADLVRRIILEESRKRSAAWLKTISVTLRQYLRFSAARGDCRPDLDNAIPVFANWRLAALPRFLHPSKVERLIASCDLTTPAGIRDHAILLLLIRLGLRSGDVATMRLEDFEWTSGTLRVRGKGRLETRLPLPQDAGDAALAYLSKVRRNVASDRVFLRISAPHKPFSSSSPVGTIVRRALRRAGIADAPSQGAHMLRHSAAAVMLRAGATLDTVGTVLRHRSVVTPSLYAKVDIAMLRQVAQPWPGGVPC